jgi:hypothetical protein
MINSTSVNIATIHPVQSDTSGTDIFKIADWLVIFISTKLWSESTHVYSRAKNVNKNVKC